MILLQPILQRLFRYYGDVQEQNIMIILLIMTKLTLTTSSAAQFSLHASLK